MWCASDLKMSDYGFKEEAMTLAKSTFNAGGLFLANPCEIGDEECTLNL